MSPRPEPPAPPPDGEDAADAAGQDDAAQRAERADRIHELIDEIVTGARPDEAPATPRELGDRAARRPDADAEEDEEEDAGDDKDH
jgi:hypothetical protein